MKAVSTEKLFELFKIVNPSATTLEKYKKIIIGDVRKALIDEIKDYLAETNYKGPFEYGPISYYFMGIDAAMNKNKELLKELPAHAKKLKEYHHFNPKTDADEFLQLTPAEENKQVMQSFREWKEQEPSQKEVVDGIIDHLLRHKTNWRIDFTKLTNVGRELIFEPLKNFFKKHILTLPIIRKYKLQFKVNGQWHTKPLDEESLNQLMRNLEEKHLLFNLDTTPAEYFYEDDGSKLPDWSMFDEIRFNEYTNYDGNNDRGGSFFRYLIKPDAPKMIIEYLNRLQIFDSLVEGKAQRKELDDNCFVYALKQTEQYDEKTLNQIRLRINKRYLSQGVINEICNEFKIQIKLTYIDRENEKAGKRAKTQVTSVKNHVKKNYLGVANPEPNRIHNMNIYESHYFLEEVTPFSTDYIKNLSNRTDEQFNKEFKGDHFINARYYMKSSNLVRTLMNNNYFVPITFGDSMILKTTFYNDVKNDLNSINLEYNPEYCTQLIAPSNWKTKDKINNYFYADFEADVSGAIHKPYMVVLQHESGEINKCWKGKDCAVKLLKYLEDGDVVYFHNLAYDIRMLAKYGMNKSIIKGSKVMKADIKFEGKTIHFRDSYPMISSKLSDFPVMFNLLKVQNGPKGPERTCAKEIFPYKYYTLERLKTNIGVISEAGKDEDKEWTDEDYKLFNSNIDSIEGCRLSDTEFDMYKYCEFYCEQDVNILRLGFNAFREGFLKDFKIDPYNFISISALANEVFNQNVYYNHNLYKVGGVVRHFMSHAIYGGRCMTAYNKKWHTTKPLSDFDAVSLYPSAMARLKTVKGLPEVIQPEQLNMKFLSSVDAYVVEIKITKVNKHYAFPLIVQKTPEGLNLNNDNITDPVTMVVDNIALEDLINFQQIEFELIKGYYWNSGTDDTIQKVIRHIFNKRLEYKKQKNPLQQLYKLIMNSCYGKTIEKPVDKDWKYFDNEKDLNKYMIKNYYKIIEAIQLGDSDIHAVRVKKPIDKHFNFSLLGIQVLSMSKRIMNEVMCLAFDLGCHIYYQDTDSFMIERDDLPNLAESFKNKYNRELIGTNLGQFHCDFPSINGHNEMPWSVEAYFIMKKMYVHKITDSSNDIDYVIRGKGLTQNSIKYATKKFNNNPLSLYKSLYEGNSQTFDLTQGQPCFEMNKNMTVSTKTKFERKIKTLYEEGEIEKYFEYV